MIIIHNPDRTCSADKHPSLFTVPNKPDNRIQNVKTYYIDIKSNEIKMELMGKLPLKDLLSFSLTLNKSQSPLQVPITDLNRFLGLDGELEDNREIAEQKGREITRKLLYRLDNNNLTDIEVKDIEQFFLKERVQIYYFQNREVQAIISNRKSGEDGIRVDIDRLDKRISEYTTRIFNQSADIDWDVDEEGIRSQKKIYQKCREIGIEPPPSLSSKDIKLQEWLKRYGKQVDFVRAILNINLDNAVLSKLRRLKEQMVGNRVRYELIYYGSHTGRFTGTGFNLHSLPATVRDLLLPDVNEVMMIADYSQIEPRIIMGLLNIDTEGRSVYEKMAIHRKIWNYTGTSLKIENPNLYNEIKTSFLRSVYMPTDGDLYRYMPEIIQLRNSYWNDFIVKMEQNRIGNNSYIYIELPSGRRLHYYGSYTKDGLQVKFTPSGILKKIHKGSLFENIISGTARDIFLDKLTTLYDNKVKVLFHIHDEFVISVSKDKTKEVEDILNAPQYLYWKNAPRNLPLSIKIVDRYE
jgi:hypothetical protein